MWTVTPVGISAELWRPPLFRSALLLEVYIRSYYWNSTIFLRSVLRRPPNSSGRVLSSAKYAARSQKKCSFLFVLPTEVNYVASQKRQQLPFFVTSGAVCFSCPSHTLAGFSPLSASLTSQALCEVPVKVPSPASKGKRQQPHPPSSPTPSPGGYQGNQVPHQFMPKIFHHEILPFSPVSQSFIA